MACRVVEQGWSLAKAAAAAEVSERTCSKWVGRYRAEDVEGLRDRSSAPRRVANRTDQQTVELIAALRRLRFTAPELADLLGMPSRRSVGCSSASGWASSADWALSPPAATSARGLAS
jgi:transposase